MLIFRDVTTQRKAHNAAARLAAIVEHSGDAMFTKNLDGNVQTWNTSAERLFGYGAEEIIGKPVTDNDGNNLYDLADYAVGPFQIVSLKQEGNNMRVTWLTAGGRTNRVQTAGVVTGAYTNLGAVVPIPGVGLVTTNYLQVGGATNATRFYRLKSEDF